MLAPVPTSRSCASERRAARSAGVLTLRFGDRRRSRLRARLDDGREVALLLPRGTFLRDGDRLSAEDGRSDRRGARREGDALLGARRRSPAARARRLPPREPARAGADRPRLAGLRARPRARRDDRGDGAGGRGASRAVRARGGRLSARAAKRQQRTEVTTTMSTDPLPFGRRHCARRLLQIVSPALPIGAFAYSQGLEQTVAEGWVTDEAEATAWLLGLLDSSFATLDLPVLARLVAAWRAGDRRRRWRAGAPGCCACRPTRELRAEDRQLGAALARVLEALGIDERQGLDDAHARHPRHDVRAGGRALRRPDRVRPGRTRVLLGGGDHQRRGAPRPARAERRAAAAGGRGRAPSPASSPARSSSPTTSSARRRRDRRSPARDTRRSTRGCFAHEAEEGRA